MAKSIDAKVAQLMVLVGHCIQAPAHQEGRDKLQSTIRTHLGEVFVAGMSCGPASVQPAAQLEPASIGGELTDADLQLLGEIADQLETDDHFFKSAELRRLKKRIAATRTAPNGKDAERMAILKAIGDAGLILIKTHLGFELVKKSLVLAGKQEQV